ncbi:gamma carbonic anhydrase family protein [Psychromicrobium xiongbiense]|uniref:gamma carbonic anhydrase family protein n=1 Tax=Psychromicrobium xiongbiense TaxID=3051184 RepID=UPI00255749E4|nr:gamma carbonic anhydrase family protein [Psychromicrobium sp. YIM S02556]
MATILSYNGNSPQIDPTAFIAPTATVIGQATIHPEASVFYGAVIRADCDAITLGARSNLQDNVAVHTDHGIQTVIGEGVSVGHGAVVHGATVGDHCLIGMHATLLNHSVIGEETLVAAGALVLEGMVIPPRSLVAGVPAKVRRELSPEEIAGLHRNADTYLALAQGHREATA